MTFISHGGRFLISSPADLLEFSTDLRGYWEQGQLSLLHAMSFYHAEQVNGSNVTMKKHLCI